MMIAKHLYRLRDELGAMGVAAIALFVGAALFMTLVLQPLKEKNRSLAARAATVSDAPASAGGAAADKLATVYDYLAKPEAATDWLAKLYAIGRATGVELHSASYKTQGAAGRLERYEMTIPLT